MRRRELMVGAGAAAICWPYAARAQQTAVPVIGFLSSRSPEDSSAQMAGFRQGLAELNYVEGENLTIEYRWARGDYERLPALAADLVGKPVRVVATVGGEPSASAAKVATSTIRLSLPAAILCGPALLRVTTGRGETSRASISCRRSSKPSGSAFCMI